WKGATVLHFKGRVKNVSDQPQRFRMNIFLDNDKAAGGLLPRRIQKGLLKPGKSAGFEYPVGGMSQKPGRVEVIIRTMAQFTGAAEAKTTYINIGAGGVHGIYYPYGGGVAEIWTKYVPDIKAVAEVTGGSRENIYLAHVGETIIGEARAEVVRTGYNGWGKFKGRKHDIFTMAVMYPNLLHVVTLKQRGITNIEQITGRSISTGSPGAGSNVMAETVLKALGISKNSYTDNQLSIPEIANALRAGTIDMGIISMGPGAHYIKALAATHDIHIISFTPEQIKKILAAKAIYLPLDLPGGFYRGVDEPTATIGVWNVMVCRKSLPADFIYPLVKALYEHNDYLRKIHPAAWYTKPKNTVRYSQIPLHPGVVKYMKEKGITVPARMM
ncbi:MAG: TAXI family TRAP transporter solute-binding subunit, partial [Desulfobacterales bacterium]|nr:TAXI family TRAP transporter solute-binding subunit [Desulfobacterales bacterium]